MKKFAIVIVLAVLSLAVVMPVAAQGGLDPDAEPTFAAVNLTAGFELDPYLLRVNGGGAQPAANFDAACAGFISSMPSVVINWRGEADLLRIYTYSNDDPTLLVVGPEDTVYCNDDMNPVVLDSAVEIQNPVEGAYAVYVGSYAEGAQAHGFLAITELPYNIATTDLSPLLERRELAPVLNLPRLPIATLNAAPYGLYGDDSLSAGFGTVEVTAAAGGSIPAFNFEMGSPDCTGFINVVPTYTFTLEGEPSTLRLVFNGEEDTTLIVEQPDDTFACNDDTAGESNLNPTLTIENPGAGEYRVFVGSYAQHIGIRGTLVVTEDAAYQADVLPYEAQ